MKLALLASGNGSNVAAIMQAINDGTLEAEIVAIVCDQPDAYVITRAKLAQLPIFVAPLKAYKTRKAWESAIADYLKEKGAEWVVLAGFMRIVGAPLLEAFPHRIVNIHPALLPNFPGRDGIGDAYAAGVTETGVTVHWVDEGIDSGPIIAQEKLTVDPTWTREELEEKIHHIEHQLYPKTLQRLGKEEEHFS
ncbi:phosphoribosylglycinamide formyltransferase [Allofustis seminis]|uniref:phosphoribosylglycinamide formyltransferase n=1 Tax=Allofustis seminis TaxID=166939 RepID=UPI00037FDFA9|nr:phosphoribosylglycinamide formyltransferase [Allofustis seminis]